MKSMTNSNAEPKPTPSQFECTEQEFQGSLPAVCPKCGDPILGEGSNPTTGVRYFSHQLKPQPDSSSISTEPEQFVSDEHVQAAIDEHKTFWSEEIAIELQQWRKWAKGQSNGR